MLSVAAIWPHLRFDRRTRLPKNRRAEPIAGPSRAVVRIRPLLCPPNWPGDLSPELAGSNLPLGDLESILRLPLGVVGPFR
jgi:hypothetical protein